MRSTVEPVEGNKVKLSVEVDGAEFEKEVDAAFRRIAKEVRLPGFRPGKAPRRLLEARIGTEAARGDAIEHAVPGYYVEALQEHEVDAIARPEIDITAGQEEGDVAFDAVVEVRPEVNLGGYESLRVTITSPEVSDEEVDERIDRLRENFAQLEAVSRPTRPGDHVTIDIAGFQDGEALDGITAEDYLYELGSATVVPELDSNLGGATVGDVLEFDAEHPDPEEDDITFRILVKDVKEKRLPEPDDAFAAEASEFDTMAELRADLVERLGLVKKMQANMALQHNTAEALAALVEEEPPEALVDAELQQRIQDLVMRLQAQGSSVVEYLAGNGLDEEALLAQLREVSVQGARVDLALRAVASAEAIDVSDEDLEAEYAAVAERVGEGPPQVRRRIERDGQARAVRSELRTRKALEWLIEHVELVDEGGNMIERDRLQIETGSQDDGSGALAAETTEDPE